jgi:hypothetical protein
MAADLILTNNLAAQVQKESDDFNTLSNNLANLI